jgi:hypothetical protein
MSFGKSSGSSTVIPTLSPEQNAMIKAQTDMFTKTVGPAYEQLTKGATNLYNQSAPGVNYAAQNLAGTAAQAQSALGGTGEAALRTGISGLQNVFDPKYQEQQMQAAMMPAQAQYTQNVANQRAAFGGSGNLGSARQALADRQLAGATQSAQMQAGAQVARDIMAGKLGAAQSLAGLGQGGLGQAVGMAGQGLNAATSPMNYFLQYGSALAGNPQAAWNPNFSGTQGRVTSGDQSNMSVDFSKPLFPKIG